MNNNNNNAVMAAFETWKNGGIQVSALYLASEEGQDKVVNFVEGNGGSFATLHTFTSEVKAIQAYDKIQAEMA